MDKKLTASGESSRPILNIDISNNDFLEFYWLKQELSAFCRKNKLPTNGSKDELTKRIYHLLKTGERISNTNKPINYNCDSTNGLNLDTLVINYKNDTATRQFFEKHIGENFRFNRIWSNSTPLCGAIKLK